CNSHYVSHFAAFFIVVGAKTSAGKKYTEVRGTNKSNDPSAGSPTETLLRLHLPLNSELANPSPEVSPNHSIGRCDGRCVQRAGT
ncbi:hypothetical protein AURANDRAFT_19522, partial [Aureococcus anophagefferens]